MKALRIIVTWLALAGGLVAVAVIGVVLKLTLIKSPSTPTLPDYGHVQRFDPQREGGHLLPDLDLQVMTESAGKSVRFVTNSKGFRNDREFSYEVPKGTQRILFSGDSFVDGMRTDQEATIGYLLERLLNDTDRAPETFEVLISGHNNPVDAWYHFQEHGGKYHPHIVLLGVTLGNDLTWHSYGSAFVPQWGPQGSVSLQLGVGEAKGVGKMLLLPTDAYTAPSTFERIHSTELRIRKSLARRFEVFGQLAPPRLGPRNSLRRHVYGGGYFVSLGLFYQPLMPEIRQMYEDFEATLAGFQQAARGAGAELALVLFPTRIQVSERDWQLLQKTYSLDAMKFDLTYPTSRIVTYCEKIAIACLDLAPQMRRLDEHGDGPFFRARGDMHFNERGQEVIAEQLARFVRDQIETRRGNRRTHLELFGAFTER